MPLPLYRMRILFLFALLPFLSLAQTADDQAFQLGMEGIQLVDKGDYKEGIRLLKQARNLKPHDYDFAFEIGKAYAKSGDFKSAEKYLYPLQYHANVQADLYKLLADCYREMNDTKKTSDEERKKELDALRYGIQKLPQAGDLYLELGKRNLEMEKPNAALATFELGIESAPNFAENYFWASKLMKAADNHLWAWLYAETCYDMTDDPELSRTAALVISESLSALVKNGWEQKIAGSDNLLQELKQASCGSTASADGLQRELAVRRCLLPALSNGNNAAKPLFERLNQLEQSGKLDAFVASIYEIVDKKVFLEWLAGNAQNYEAYSKWRYWNPIKLNEPIHRTMEN